MAIRFDKNYNREINRIVHNFNQKRNRAIKRGFTHLPPRLLVSELKSRYDTRSELNRELALIESFNKGRDDSLKIVETSGGAKAIQWEYDYLKANINQARAFFDRQIKEASDLDTTMVVAKAEYINNLKAKREFLDLELSELSQPDFNTYRSTVNDYLYDNTRNLRAYRNWLQEVEVIMKHLGFDNKTINQFFSGFEELTPRQFLNMYRQSGLVSRIYELYLPTKSYEDFRLSTTEDDAKELIRAFMEEKDTLISKAKME